MPSKGQFPSWLLLCSMLVFFVNAGWAAHPSPGWTLEHIDSLAEQWPGNAIEFFPDTMLWKQDSDRPLTILQIGDSHIQADVSVNSVRKYLMERLCLPPQPKGYVFPFAIAKSNEAYDIKSRGKGWKAHLSTREKQSTAPYGLAAASLEAINPSAYLSIRLRPKHSNIALPKRVRVLFEPSKYACTPMLNKREPSCVDWEKGMALFIFEEPPQSLALCLRKPAKGKGEFRLLGFMLSDREARLAYQAAGLNGADTQSLMRATNLESQLEIAHPDIIILSLGTNDAYNTQFTRHDFRRDYTALLSRIRTACPGTIVILATPNDHLFKKRKINPRTASAAEVIREIAKEQGCALWDFHRIMGGEGSIRSWSNNSLTAHDLLHFSPTGYTLQGRLLGTALYRALTRMKDTIPAE